MPIFKTLRASGGEHILNGRVDCGWESWNTLDGALNELGACGWEIHAPVYGSLPGLGPFPATWPVAIIMINRSADMPMETERQIAKLRREIGEIRDKFGISSRAKELQGILDGLVKTKAT